MAINVTSEQDNFLNPFNCRSSISIIISSMVKGSMDEIDDDESESTFLSDVHVAVNPDEYRDRLREHVGVWRVAS